jgi:hypothetical protein
MSENLGSDQGDLVEVPSQSTFNINSDGKAIKISSKR